MDAEDNGELPEGWAALTIGEAVTVHYGKALKADDRKPGNLAVYGSGGIVGTHSAPLTGGKTIVIGRKGSVGSVFYNDDPCWPIDTTYFITEFGPFAPRFLFHLLGALDLPHLDTSSAIPGLNRDDLYSVLASLPPLAEQRRIVAAVEGVLAKVNVARERLNRVPAILKRFRQAVLSAACSGRLTADWRERNSLAEPAESWPSYPASEVCKLVQSGTTPRDRTGLTTDVPFLKVYNIVDQRVAFKEKPQFISEETHKGDSRRAVAKPGDVIMNIVGPPLGKVAIIPDDYPEWSVNQAITIFRPSANLSRDYLYHLLCSGIPYEDVLMETRGSAGQTNISLSQCRNMRFTVPPLAEQQEIVRRVGDLFALADVIEARLTDARRMADQLTQAVLAKAFRGELVPTEAALARRENRTYEPASDLLARIRAEREQPAAPAKPARKPSRTAGSG